MANSIPFTDKLQQRVGTVLEDAGFHLTRASNATVEVVRYEQTKTGFIGRDTVEFHGTEDEDNWIYAEATSSQNKLTILTTIKLLMPNFESLQFPNTSRWEYKSEEELDSILEEIAALVKKRLLAWFEHPELEHH